MARKKHILIVVENLPVPFDRRVWQEATTLKNAGYDISIICPVMKGYDKRHEVIEGIRIYRHPLLLEASGAMGYLLEYGSALFWEFILSVKIFLRNKFQIIHGCNPPDLIFIVALFYKIFGVKYIFDHHDINPELFIAKYNRKGFLYKLMLLFERLTFKTASASIATNNSYKEIAIRRGKMPESRVQVIRSGPNLNKLKIMEPVEKYKKGRTFLVGYVGVIGEQEGIDLLLDSVKIITDKRKDIQFAVVGGGTDFERVVKLSEELGLEEFVNFYGRVDDMKLLEILNTSDVCVNPDKPTEMNNLSTMNKIMEYMALKKPIVQFDLKEGRFSAQEASLYSENWNVNDFAEKIIQLIDNESLRKKMGDFGFEKVKNELNWDIEARKLIAFYNKVLTK